MKTIFVAILFAFAVPVLGQENFISGKIEDEAGKPIEGVNIAVLNTQRGCASDSEGEFKIDKLPGNSYQLKISATGFAGQQILVHPS